jgi:N-acyl-D-amino-acid deacylase
MKHPRSAMTFSDAGAHVSQIADCSVQTHLLGHWVRGKQAFTFEEAIRMLTLVPASIWGFADRGLVRQGMVADLNVIDTERVSPEMPRLVADLPGGAHRIMQGASGFLATVVAGEPTLENGTPTGALPGSILRSRSKGR